MKKNLKKILILLILFVLAAAGYFTWSWMQLREDGAVYTSIEDANLPVAYVNILGTVSWRTARKRLDAGI